MDQQDVDPARDAARHAIEELLKRTNPGAFGVHHRHGEGLVVERDPSPLLALAAARTLVVAVQRQVIAQALRARSAGDDWLAVADALELTDGESPDAAAAYLAVLGVRSDDPWWSPARGVVWTCTCCESVVRDFGPDGGGPAEQEAGHAPTCSRHAADVVAWEALWA